MSDFNYDQQEDILVDEIEVIDKSELIVYNDDHNTFDWVIKCFIEVCNHTFEQSEQLINVSQVIQLVI